MQAPAGTSPHVNFTVVSEPPSLLDDVKHTLKKVGGEAVVTRRFKIEENRITFQNLKVSDSGIYTISCCINDGEIGQETLELEVTESGSLQSTNICKFPNKYIYGCTVVCTCIMICMYVCGTVIIMMYDCRKIMTACY